MAQRRDARGRERAERGAVVGDLAADELDLARVAGPLVVGARQLDRRLHRLRAAGGEEDAVQVARRQRGDPRGQLDRPRVRVAPDREEVELGDLPRRGLAQLRPPVAGVDAEQRREAVQVALAVLVPHVRPLAPDDDRHLAVVVGAVAREVHPQMPLGELLEARVGGRRGPRAGGGHSSPSVLTTASTDGIAKTDLIRNPPEGSILGTVHYALCITDRQRFWTSVHCGRPAGGIVSAARSPCTGHHSEERSSGGECSGTGGRGARGLGPWRKGPEDRARSGTCATS